MRLFTFAVALLLLSTLAHAEEPREWCGTPSPSAELAGPFLERLQQSELRFLPKASISIPIAFHVIHDGQKGKLTKEQVQAVINNVNWAFRDTPYTFYLHHFSSLKNKTWYLLCAVDPVREKQMRKRLALDVRRYVNVYSCKPGAGILGISTFPPGYPVPGNPGMNYLQGITVDPIIMGSEKYPYGLILAHEIGHYLGLFHTFESFFNPEREKCAEPGDFVEDTAAQRFHFLNTCPASFDSCPELPGRDDVPNFMNYSTEACMQRFSPGQIERMNHAIEEYRPTLGNR